MGWRFVVASWSRFVAPRAAAGRATCRSFPWPGCRFAIAVDDRSTRHVRFARFPASAQQVVYRFVCDLFGADEGGISSDLRLDLRFGQPRRIAMPDGVLLAKFGIDPDSKVLPDSGIGPILRVIDPPTERAPRPHDHPRHPIRTSLTASEAGVDPFDQTT
jgi:hypothetical protein